MGYKKASAQSLRYLIRCSRTQFSEPPCQRSALAAVVLELLSAESGIDEDAAVSEQDFVWFPRGALVILNGIIPYRLPFLVKPIQIRFVIGNAPAAFMRRMMKTRSGEEFCRLAWPERSGGNPFLDGLPGWLDGLYAFDIDGRRWWTRYLLE